MSAILGILMILTSILLGILILGIIIKNDGLITAGSVFLTLMVILGWGATGFGYPAKHIFNDISPKAYKTSSAVVLEYKDVRTILDDARSYNLVNDSTKYQLKTDFNMYGFQVGKNIVIKE